MEIYPGSKLRHFREIHRRTGIPYEQMVRSPHFLLPSLHPSFPPSPIYPLSPLNPCETKL